MKIVTLLRKNGETPKRVVDFPVERDTCLNKIMKIVEDFACEDLKSSKISPFFFIFLSFFHFCHFLIFHFL